MGRWDALKPDERNEGSKQTLWRDSCIGSTPARDNNPDLHPTRNKHNDRQIRRDRAGKRGGPRRTSVWASMLEEQLGLYQKNGSGFQKSRLESTLNEISESSTENPICLSLVSVVNILEIEDDKIQEMALEIISDHANDDLLATDAVACVEKLARLGMLQPRSLGILQCLGRLTAGQAKHLPAEDTSERVVGSILLPALDATTHDEAAMASICKSVGKLLLHPSFASALLVPLVQDVTDEGKEETAPNLVRRSLFQSLQRRLFDESLSLDLRTTACSVLTTAVEKWHKLNRSKANVDLKELDQALLERFFVDHLRLSSSLYQPSCTLLKALFQVYPLTKLGTRLLFSGSATNVRHELQMSSTCSFCGCRPTQFNTFLASVHASLGASLAESSMDCVTELVIALPLGLWLKQPTSGPRGPVSGFYRKVVESLVNVLTIARCAVLRQRASADAMGNLCKEIFQHIPWNDDQVIKAGEDLWITLISRFDDGDTAYQKKISDILVHGMGGKVTPQGSLTSMIPPARQWLSHGAKAVSFLCNLLAAIQSEKSPLSMLVFCSILRSRPESVLPCWVSFHDFIECIRSGKPKQQEMCVDLLEALLLGRKDFPCDEMHGMSSTIAKLFFDSAICLRGTVDVKGRCGVLRCYTALKSEDWSFLENDHIRLSDHVEWLLDCCSDSFSNVRGASCRGIGEFCALYLEHSRLAREERASNIRALVNRIGAVIAERLKVEPNASAQAMMIFALGNLALALVENGGLGFFDECSTVNVSMTILCVMDNSSDKVIGNAIRSIGHFGSILIFFQEYQMVVNILNALCFRISRTVAVASHEEHATMTWKERSTATKHGWGACHSLGRIFHAMIHEAPTVNDALRRSIQQLSQCILRANVLSEKVVLASMAAFRELKPPCLVDVVGDGGLLGEALAGIIVLLFREDSNCTLVQQGDLLLAHLVSCASIADATIVLRNDEVSRPVLDCLYRWMVDHEMEGKAFEIFALALQRPGFASRNDVSLEQRFSSRALMQSKKGLHGLLQRDEHEDEAEDEL